MIWEGDGPVISRFGARVLQSAEISVLSVGLRAVQTLGVELKVESCEVVELVFVAASQIAWRASFYAARYPSPLQRCIQYESSNRGMRVSHRRFTPKPK